MHAKVSKILGLSLLLCSGVQAFGGFYLGIDAGGAYILTTMSYVDYNGKDKEKVNKIGGIGGGHVGFLYELGTSKTIIGLELYGTFGAVSVNDPLGAVGFPTIGNCKSRRKTSVGGALVLGKMMNLKTMAYGKVGFESASYHFHNSFPAAPATPLPLQGKSIVLKRSLNGVMVGLGLSYKVASFIVLGGEFTMLPGLPNKTVLDYTTSSPAYNGVQTKFLPFENRLMARLSFIIG